MRPRIELHIERLVLDGFDVDRARLTEALQVELHRLLEQPEAVSFPARAPTALATTGASGATAGVHARTGHSASAAHSPEHVGIAIARAVHGSLPR